MLIYFQWVQLEKQEGRLLAELADVKVGPS